MSGVPLSVIEQVASKRESSAVVQAYATALARGTITTDLPDTRSDIAAAVRAEATGGAALATALSADHQQALLQLNVAAQGTARALELVTALGTTSQQDTGQAGWAFSIQHPLAVSNALLPGPSRPALSSATAAAAATGAAAASPQAKRRGRPGIVHANDAMAAKTVPSTRQADLRTYFVPALARRLALRERSARIKAVLRRWWELAAVPVGPGGEPDGSEGTGSMASLDKPVQQDQPDQLARAIPRERYIQVCSLIWAILVPDGSPEDGACLAELDWHRDLARAGDMMGGMAACMTELGQSVLPQVAWDAAMFDLADTWCSTVTELEYAKFLCYLHDRVSEVLAPDAVLIKQRRTEVQQGAPPPASGIAGQPAAGGGSRRAQIPAVELPNWRKFLLPDSIIRLPSMLTRREGKERRNHRTGGALTHTRSGPLNGPVSIHEDVEDSDAVRRAERESCSTSTDSPASDSSDGYGRLRGNAAVIARRRALRGQISDLPDPAYAIQRAVKLAGEAADEEELSASSSPSLASRGSHASLRSTRSSAALPQPPARRRAALPAGQARALQAHHLTLVDQRLRRLEAAHAAPELSEAAPKQRLAGGQATPRTPRFTAAALLPRKPRRLVLPGAAAPLRTAGAGLAGFSLGSVSYRRAQKAGQLGLAAPAFWYAGEWLLHDKAPGMYSVSVAAEFALAIAEAEARRREALNLHAAQVEKILNIWNRVAFGGRARQALAMFSAGLKPSSSDEPDDGGLWGKVRRVLSHLPGSVRDGRALAILATMPEESSDTDDSAAEFAAEMQTFREEHGMGVHAVDYITATLHTPLPSPTARPTVRQLTIRAGGSSGSSSDSGVSAETVHSASQLVLPAAPASTKLVRSTHDDSKSALSSPRVLDSSRSALQAAARRQRPQLCLSQTSAMTRSATGRTGRFSFRHIGSALNADMEVSSSAAGVPGSPRGMAGMASMAREKLLSRMNKYPRRLNNALPVPARFGVGADCMVRDWELLGVRPVLLAAELRHRGLVPGVGGRRGGAGAASAALAARGSQRAGPLWQEAPGSASQAGPVFVDDRCGAWVWLAEMPLEHTARDVGAARPAKGSVRATRIIGLFPDQLTAALAYDSAVRERRAALNIRLSVELALQDRKPMYTVMGGTGKKGAGAQEPMMSIAPETAQGMLAWGVHGKAAARRRKQREHCLYTNFSIVGQLLRPPRHTRRPRVYFPSDSHPGGRQAAANPVHALQPDTLPVLVHQTAGWVESDNTMLSVGNALPATTLQALKGAGGSTAAAARATIAALTTQLASGRGMRIALPGATSTGTDVLHSKVWQRYRRDQLRNAKRALRAAKREAARAARRAARLAAAEAALGSAASVSGEEASTGSSGSSSERSSASASAASEGGQSTSSGSVDMPDVRALLMATAGDDAVNAFDEQRAALLSRAAEARGDAAAAAAAAKAVEKAQQRQASLEQTRAATQRLAQEYQDRDRATRSVQKQRRQSVMQLATQGGGLSTLQALSNLSSNAEAVLAGGARPRLLISALPMLDVQPRLDATSPTSTGSEPLETSRSPSPVTGGFLGGVLRRRAQARARKARVKSSSPDVRSVSSHELPANAGTRGASPSWATARRRRLSSVSESSAKPRLRSMRAAIRGAASQVPSRTARRKRRRPRRKLTQAQGPALGDSSGYASGTQRGARPKARKVTKPKAFKLGKARAHRPEHSTTLGTARTSASLPPRKVRKPTKPQGPNLSTSSRVRERHGVYEPVRLSEAAARLMYMRDDASPGARASSAPALDVSPSAAAAAAAAAALARRRLWARLDVAEGQVARLRTAVPLLMLKPSAGTHWHPAVRAAAVPGVLTASLLPLLRRPWFTTLLRLGLPHSTPLQAFKAIASAPRGRFTVSVDDTWHELVSRYWQRSRAALAHSTALRTEQASLLKDVAARLRSRELRVADLTAREKALLFGLRAQRTAAAAPSPGKAKRLAMDDMVLGYRRWVSHFSGIHTRSAAARVAAGYTASTTDLVYSVPGSYLSFHLPQAKAWWLSFLRRYQAAELNLSRMLAALRFKHLLRGLRSTPDIGEQISTEQPQREAQEPTEAVPRAPSPAWGADERLFGQRIAPAQDILPASDDGHRPAPMVLPSQEDAAGVVWCDVMEADGPDSPVGPTRWGSETPDGKHRVLQPRRFRGFGEPAEPASSASSVRPGASIAPARTGVYSAVSTGFGSNQQPAQPWALSQQRELAQAWKTWLTSPAGAAAIERTPEQHAFMQAVVMRAARVLKHAVGAVAGAPPGKAEAVAAAGAARVSTALSLRSRVVPATMAMLHQITLRAALDTLGQAGPARRRAGFAGKHPLQLTAMPSGAAQLVVSGSQPTLRQLAAARATVQRVLRAHSAGGVSSKTGALAALRLQGALQVHDTQPGSSPSAGSRALGPPVQPGQVLLHATRIEGPEFSQAASGISPRPALEIAAVPTTSLPAGKPRSPRAPMGLKAPPRPMPKRPAAAHRRYVEGATAVVSTHNSQYMPMPPSTGLGTAGYGALSGSQSARTLRSEVSAASLAHSQAYAHAANSMVTSLRQLGMAEDDVLSSQQRQRQQATSATTAGAAAGAATAPLSAREPRHVAHAPWLQAQARSFVRSVDEERLLRSMPEACESDSERSTFAPMPLRSAVEAMHEARAGLRSVPMRGGGLAGLASEQRVVIGSKSARKAGRKGRSGKRKLRRRKKKASKLTEAEKLAKAGGVNLAENRAVARALAQADRMMFVTDSDVSGSDSDSSAVDEVRAAQLVSPRLVTGR